MQHRVSPSYLAGLRGGPRRAIWVGIGSYACVAALALAQTETSQPLALAFAALVGGFAIAIAIRRMRKMTAGLEQTTYEVVASGIKVATEGQEVVIPSAEIQTITLIQSLLSRKLQFFEISTSRGQLAMAPIEDADEFSRQVRLQLPQVTMKEKRSFVAVG